MLRVAVAGASGYMGAELLRLLSVHPKVQLTAVTSERLAGEPLDKVYPHLRGLSSLVFQEVDAERIAEEADLVFLALPHMESQRAVPVLRRHGRKVVDLSADYRLRDASLYGTWYKAPHIDADGLSEAVYGLPELHRKAIAAAASGRLAGLLCHGRYPRHRAFAQERARLARGHRDRRQIGGDGGGGAGSEDRADVPLHRGQRERAGLRPRRHPPAHARDRAGAVRAGGRAGGGELHPPSPAP